MTNPFEGMQTEEAILAAADVKEQVYDKNSSFYSEEVKSLIERLIKERKLIRVNTNPLETPAYATPALAKKNGKI